MNIIPFPMQRRLNLPANIENPDAYSIEIKSRLDEIGILFDEGVIISLASRIVEYRSRSVR